MPPLPLPTPDALTHSALLAETIRTEIAAAGGWIGFDRFMDRVLYTPGLGYYSAGAEKLGECGDFVTAPELSPLFGRTLARQVAQVLRQTGGEVLELGAGSGRLAADLLSELDRLGVLPQRYLILEVSSNLRKRQEILLKSDLDMRFMQKMAWLDALPEHFNGVVIGNELLDALPVHIITQKDNGPHERGVAVDDEKFIWEDRPTQGAVRDLSLALNLPPGYITEIGLAARALMTSLAAMLDRGIILMVDYGFSRGEYYHPQRSQGTLMCHYRHHAHDDPFAYLGLQDITAHVDFSGMLEAGIAQNAELLGYAGQAQFLINCGITDLLAETPSTDASAYYPLASAAQKLLSPAEMGELFKVMALGKKIDFPLIGFTRGDRRHAL